MSRSVPTMLPTHLEVYLLSPAHDTGGLKFALLPRVLLIAISESLAMCVSVSLSESGKQVGQRVVMWVCT